MSTGIPFTPKLTDVADAIRKYKGNLANVAKSFNVSRDTIYQYINKYHELKPLIEEVRNYNHHDIVDSAEYILNYAIAQYKDNLSRACDTAKFILDRRGKTRGWGDGNESDSQKKIGKKLDRLMDQIEDSHSYLIAEESDVNVNTDET
jgi:membrane-associated HD superfamily phosphohydrolase